jgi:hypothetical protein
MQLGCALLTLCYPTIAHCGAANPPSNPDANDDDDDDDDDDDALWEDEDDDVSMHDRSSSPAWDITATALRTAITNTSLADTNAPSSSENAGDFSSPALSQDVEGPADPTDSQDPALSFLSDTTDVTSNISTHHRPPPVAQTHLWAVVKTRKGPPSFQATLNTIGRATNSTLTKLPVRGPTATRKPPPTPAPHVPTATHPFTPIPITPHPRTPALPTTSGYLHARTRTTPDQQRQALTQALALDSPVNELVAVGIYSHFLVLTPYPNIPSTDIEIQDALTNLAAALSRESRPFAFVPVMQAIRKPGSATIPYLPGVPPTSYSYHDPDSDYIRHRTFLGATGWHIRITTPFSTASAIRLHLAAGFQPRYRLKVREPSIFSPLSVTYCPYHEATDYVRIGWFLFSTRHTCPVALEMEIILQLQTRRPEWRWHHRLVIVTPGEVSDPAQFYTTNAAPCLRIFGPPDIYATIDRLLREIFLRPIADRPMGRPLFYIPDLPTTTQPPTTPWPDPYHYQRVWYKGADRHRWSTPWDPYATLSVRGELLTHRQFALSLLNPAGSPIFAAFDRKPSTTPYAQLGSNLYAHTRPPQSTDLGQYYNHHVQMVHTANATNAALATTAPFPALHPHTKAPPHSGRGPHHTTHPFDDDHAYLKTLRSGTSAFVKLQTHHPLFEHLLPPAPPPPPSTPASHPNPYMRPPPPSRTGILGHWPRSPLHPPPLPRLPALFIVATHPPLQQTPSANPHRLPTRTPHRHPLLHPPIALRPVRSASGGQIQPLVFNHLSV